MPTIDDMKTSLDDAKFFYEQLEPVIRGPEQGQDLQLIRRLFRAYLHCWKCVLDFVRKAKGLETKNDWKRWCKEWERQQGLSPGDCTAFRYLRETRDHDTHEGIVQVDGEVAAGLFPIVMFQPADQSDPRTELISCCERGLAVAEQLIHDHTIV